MGGIYCYATHFFIVERWDTVMGVCNGQLYSAFTNSLFCIVTGCIQQVMDSNEEYFERVNLLDTQAEFNITEIDAGLGEMADLINYIYVSSINIENTYKATIEFKMDILTKSLVDIAHRVDSWYEKLGFTTNFLIAEVRCNLDKIKDVSGDIDIGTWSVISSYFCDSSFDITKHKFKGGPWLHTLNYTQFEYYTRYNQTLRLQDIDNVVFNLVISGFSDSYIKDILNFFNFSVITIRGIYSTWIFLKRFINYLNDFDDITKLNAVFNFSEINFNEDEKRTLEEIKTNYGVKIFTDKYECNKYVFSLYGKIDLQENDCYDVSMLMVKDGIDEYVTEWAV